MGYVLLCEQCHDGDVVVDRALAEQFLVDHSRHLGVWVVHSADLTFSIEVADATPATA